MAEGKLKEKVTSPAKAALAAVLACSLALMAPVAPDKAAADTGTLTAGAVSTQAAAAGTAPSGKVVYTTPKSPEKVITSSNVAVTALYSKSLGDWMYTTSAAEARKAKAAGYADKGTAWVAPKAGKAVYQLTNPKTGRHAYTASKAVRDKKKAAGWKAKVAFRSATGAAARAVYSVKSGSATRYRTSSANATGTAGWKAVKPVKKYKTVEHAATKVRVKSTGKNYYHYTYKDGKVVGKERIAWANRINKKSVPQIVAMLDQIIPFFAPYEPYDGTNDYDAAIAGMNRLWHVYLLYDHVRARELAAKDYAALKKLKRDLLNQVYTHKYYARGKNVGLGDKLFDVQFRYEYLIEGESVGSGGYVDRTFPVDAYTEKVLYYLY